MKKHLRLLAWVLSLVMLCQVVPVAAFAESDLGQVIIAAVQNINEENAIASGTCGENLTWELESPGILTISGTGVMTNYNEKTAPWLYCSSTKIRTVIVEQGVTSIGDYAFASCSDLEEVMLWEGITSIGKGAFKTCSKLKSLTLPKSVTAIGDNAFSNCTALESITLSENVTNVGGFAFSSCSALKSIKLSENIINIEPFTFSGCKNLTDIVLPNSLVSIGESAFLMCKSLKCITIPETVTSIGNSAFSLCDALDNIVLPEGITSIEPETFNFCSSLTNIVIPEGVMNIGERAFADCGSLASIEIPESVTDIGKSAFYDCANLKSITIPAGITSIEDYTLDGCSSLTSVTIPDSVILIGGSAFASCKNLSDVYYKGTPEQWKKIGIGSQNSGLTNATIHYKDEEPEPNPDPDPEPEPDQTQKFKFGRDNFRFKNSSNAFFGHEKDETHGGGGKDLLTGEPSYDHYTISKEKFDQLTVGLTASQEKKIRKHAYNHWDGSCYGLSVLAMMHYVAPIRVPLNGFDLHSEDDPETIYSLTSPFKSINNTDLINYYYLTQYLPSVSKLWYSRTAECKKNPALAVEKIVSSLRENIPVNVSVKSKKATHGVLLLDILSETDSYYVLRVYNSNYIVDSDSGVVDAMNMKLYKNPSGKEIKIEYRDYERIGYYVLGNEISKYDPVNYFGFSAVSYSDTAADTDTKISTITAPTASSFAVTMGESSFTVTNGEITSQTDDLENTLIAVNPIGDSDDAEDSIVEFMFPQYTGNLEIDFSSDTSTSDSMDILWNNSFLSVSTNGVRSLNYDEATRTVDVKADNPTAVSLLMTQNTPGEAWPWHSWAIDTTDTTELHARLDDDGLHLTGDGISGAVVATENAETEKTDTITLPAKAEGEATQEVTISSKKDDATEDDKLTIGGSDSTDPNPTEPTNPTEPSKPSNGSDSGTTKPSTPAAPAGSSGDGDSGAGALLLVGGAAAAAAITAGVVLSMPVEVQGKAELADHTPLAGAKISLLKDGKVVEQTTADEAGAFSVKVKRGEYQLTAAYTNAEGQIIHQTINVKAPAKDLTVMF